MSGQVRATGTEQRSVVLYATRDGRTTLDVFADGDSVWLTRAQIADLFGRDIKTIGKHVVNALREELDGMAVVAKFATTAADGKVYQTEHFNLDMILSIGYRVKSAEGVHFRRWATDVLKRYLDEGVAVNERRLDQLGSIVQILARSSDQLVAGVADLIAGYLPGLRMLRDYDEGDLGEIRGRASDRVLTLEDARDVIDHVRQGFEADSLFGRNEAKRSRASSALSTKGSRARSSMRRWRRKPRICFISWSRTIPCPTGTSAVPQRSS